MTLFGMVKRATYVENSEWIQNDEQQNSEITKQRKTKWRTTKQRITKQPFAVFVDVKVEIRCFVNTLFCK